MQEIRRQLNNHEGRISRLESWREELRARHSNTPAWIFGALSIAASVAFMLVTLYVSGGGP